MPSPFNFGSLMASTTPAKPTNSPRPTISQFDQNKATGNLLPGQKYVGGQLISGPGARPLSAAQQDDVDAANAMNATFKRLNAGAGGAGRAGIGAQPPAPQPQAPAQPQAQSPSLYQRMKGMVPGPSSWAGQTGSPSSAGPISSPMSNVSTAFNNATGQSDPPHIITTDNGRKFNTQTKTFLDGRPGGFAR